MKTEYVDLNEITDLQVRIMKFVDWWVREKETPVPKTEIFKKMESEGVKDFTIRFSLESLVKKGYIRHAIIISTNKTSYVQIRRV